MMPDETQFIGCYRDGGTDGPVKMSWTISMAMTLEMCRYYGVKTMRRKH